MGRPSVTSLIWKDMFLGIGIIFALASPIPSIAFVFLDYDVLNRNVPPPPKKSLDYSNKLNSILWFSGSFLVLGTALVLWRGHSVWCLTKRGVIVTGRVVSTGGLVYKGYRDITYAFEYDGREIRTSVSVPALGSLYEESSEVTVLVDEKNPNRNMLL